MGVWCGQVGYSIKRLSRLCLIFFLIQFLFVGRHVLFTRKELLTRRVATSRSISTASRAAWCFPTVRSDITLGGEESGRRDTSC